MKSNETKKTRLFAVLITAVMLGLIAVMIADLLPLLRKVVSSAGREETVVRYIDSYGLKGVPILIGLQALQVILAVVPSAAIQVLTGLCYGVWWGTLINLAGCVLGNMLIFTAMRQLGSLLAPLAKKISQRKDGLSADKLSRLRRPELAAFLLFLIPGIPNGIMPYLFSRTKISAPKYILAILAGSVPSTFLCTFLGDRLSQGSYGVAIAVASVIAAVIAAVLIFKKKIMALLSRKVEQAPDGPPAENRDGGLG